MKTLASLRASDVDKNAPDFDYDAFTPRTAGRAIVYDGKRVALIYVSKHGYYMLPGGGIDEADIESGLRREIKEELGCDAKILGEVGAVEVYFDLWQQKQTDYCYTAEKVVGEDSRNITDFEEEEGHNIVWTTDLSEAITLVADASPENRDGKLVQIRDLLFLKTASETASLKEQQSTNRS